MPLSAVIDGERVDSTLLSDEEWIELRASYRGRLSRDCGVKIGDLCSKEIGGSAPGRLIRPTQEGC